MTATSLDATGPLPPTAGPTTMTAATREIDRREAGRQVGRTGAAAVPARRGWNYVLPKTARAAVGRHPRRLAPAVTYSAPKGPRPKAGAMMAAALVTNKRTGEARRTAVLIHMAITGCRSTLIFTIGRMTEAIGHTVIASMLVRRPRGTLLIVRMGTRTKRRIDTYPTGSRRTAITDAVITVATASMPARHRTDDRRTKAMPAIMVDRIATMAIGGLRLMTVTKINRLVEPP
ncbi:MAG TPA: hypothetical protein VFI31_13045 [Pirellulales bacterium]|nr:hypothetical protein [Pirellulales bacterium]